MYSRQVLGKELTFGVSGKLVMNALVLYDRQSDSLWSQILGEAIAGSMKGAKMEFVPALHTTWTDWKTRYPNTLALVKGYTQGNGVYSRYFQSTEAGVLGESVIDNRLATKEFVIGVAHNDHAVAYPFRQLSQEPVVNDRIGEMAVLVVFNAETGAGVVFNRQIGHGRTLTFKVKEGQMLVDEETGSTWDGISGQAISGELAGEQLQRLKSTAAFWFGWKDWYPHTQVYGK
ncbi:MAG: hypothetical protein A2W35_13935 [Chloroflexi bacterium RBG_16_57_11]|nr:MAG: hypothetical protein A2W35_13935 [Chloroflexi bacterium RBG_16_57_11]